MFVFSAINSRRFIEVTNWVARHNIPPPLSYNIEKSIREYEKKKGQMTVI